MLDARREHLTYERGLREGEDIQVAPNTLWYVPSTVGSDEFAYTVRDPEGLEGRGIVRIAVVPSNTNSPPVAVTDHLTAVPGKTLEANVVANDNDPDGDDIELVDAPELREGVREVREVRPGTGVILVRVSDSAKPGDKVVVRYRIRDDVGQTAESTLVVDIVPPGTAGAPPVAVDDLQAPAEPGDQLSVPILDNDADPDGLVGALHVVVDPTSPVKATWSARTMRLVFEMPEAPVQLRYTLVDKDENRASAFVVVPLASREALRTTPDALTVEPGQVIPIDVVANDLPKGAVELDSFTKLPTAGTVENDGGKALYTAPKDGDATVDGFSYKVHLKDDPSKTAEGAVTITIERKENHPPSLSGLEVTVPAGGDATIDDLARSVTDADAGDEFRFELLGGGHEKVQPDLQGSRLKVHAEKDAYSVTKGQVTPLTIKVTDNGEPPLSAEAQVRVVLQPTSTPPPTVTNDTFDVLRKTGRKELDILGNDVGDGLKLLDFEQPRSGEGQVSPSGEKLVFTPPDDQEGNFSGTTQFTYRVTDDSGEESHQVTGNVTVNIVGKPDKPGTPTGEAGSKQVDLRWSAPTPRGAPISRYEVRDQANGVSQRCDSATCTIVNLKNGTTYHFEVRAVALFGGDEIEGDWSAASADLRPDKIPDPPSFGAPTINDKELIVTWTDATTSEGTAIQRYDLTLIPAHGGQATQAPTGGTHQATFTGLTNGTDYQVRMTAHNEAGDSDAVTSQSMRPYGVPLFGGTPPSATAGDKQIDVQWPTADSNGSPVTQYHLQRYKGGSKDGGEQSFGPDVHSTTVQNLDNGTGYTFEVVAQNARGRSLPTAKSAAVIASGPPMQVGAITTQEQNTQVTLTFTAPDPNGNAISSYRVTPSGLSARTMNGAASGTVTLVVTGLNNGTAYTFSVAACNNNPTSQKCGTASTSPSATPYGPPGTPSVSSPGQRPQGDYTLTWSWTAPNANGRAITGYTLRVDGGGTFSVGAGQTSYSQSFGASQAHSLYVWAVNAPGSQSANPGSGSGTTGATPPRVIVSIGEAYNPQGCNSGCERINVTLEGFPAGNYSAVLYCSTCGSNNRTWGGSFTGAITVHDGANATSYAYGEGGEVWAVVNGVESNHQGGW